MKPVSSSFTLPISLDTLYAIAVLFPEPFLALPYAILHQASFLTFAHFFGLR
jgi:hypothetical protein